MTNQSKATTHADDEVVFIDGVGAARSSIKSCRNGVQWIMVGDRVYWPLSDSDAKRLQSACCGNGSFDGPTAPADAALLAERNQLASEVEALRAEVDALREVLAELITWIPSADTYRRLGFDPAAPMQALMEAKSVLRGEGKQ